MEFQESPKDRDFAKGLVHVFCQKIELLIMCVFLANQFKKISFFDILYKKEGFLDQKKKV